jgi:hypothetical protein
MIFFRSPSSNPLVGSYKMDFIDPTIAALSLLGTLVFGLIGVVAWLYWQQSKLFTNMNSLITAFSELVQQTHFQQSEPQEAQAPVPPEDDRVSVEEEDEPSKGPFPEVVEGPPAPLDTDTLDSKTKKELHDILTKRGIPFGKNDSKNVLVSLLKATT